MKVFGYIVQAIVFALIVYIIIDWIRDSRPTNPRDMNGKTVLRSRDSVYFISFTIDSVQAKKYDPPERPD